MVGALVQIRRALKPDGLFLGAFLGGSTLTELRQALTDAESEILGGAGSRVSPFADSRDAAGLLQRAGFALPVADVDRVNVSYEHPLKLMADLRADGRDQCAGRPPPARADPRPAGPRQRDLRRAVRRARRAGPAPPSRSSP